jgi:lipopolysaccharide biosynthesis glycosyltransferase
MKPIPIFIGYDPREAVAYHTCVNSIIRHASKPVAIIPLALNLFEDYKETHTDGSNQFIYSRFLVPHLMEYKGKAIFIDGDMIVRDDIVKLWNSSSISNYGFIVRLDPSLEFNPSASAEHNLKYLLFSFDAEIEERA